MSKHTPGPWQVNHIDGEKFRIVDSRDMLELSNIATVHFHDDEEGETKANAKLIAAAPELMTALLQIIEEAGLRMGFAEADGAVFGTINRMAYCARQAIAKATGGSGI
jgi:hypothetical protein